MEQNKLSKADKELLKALQGDSNGLKIQIVMDFLWQLKWIIVLTVTVALLIAFFYVKMQTPLYSSASKVMFVDDRSGSNELSIIADITGRKQKNTLDDEILILKSPALMAKAIEQIGANYRYYQYKLPLFHTSFPLLRDLLNIKEYEFYKDSPISMKVNFSKFYPETDRPRRILLEIKAHDDSHYLLMKSNIDGSIKEYSNNGKTMKYGSRITFSGFDVVINKDQMHEMIEGDVFKAEYVNANDMGTQFSSMLAISLDEGLTSTTTNMMSLCLSDNKAQRAADLINELMEVYKAQSKEFKNQAAMRSIEFIDERLATVSQELGSVETASRDYQKYNDYVVADGGINPENRGSYSAQLNELRLQMTFLNMLKNEIAKMKAEEYRVIPANVGLDDGGVNNLVTAYNTLVAERGRLIANASENNPSVQRYTVMVQEAKENVTSAISNLERVFVARERELTRLASASKTERLNIPRHTYDLSKMERRQKIIEPLYIELNERKEEIMLSMYSITDNVRVIEEAHPNDKADSPNVSAIYRTAFLIGFLLPVMLVLGRKFLRTKVETKEDVTKVIDRPLLATIPLSKTGTTLISSSNSHDSTSESFRILRSSMQFMQGKMVQVTSSMPHEGKSYVAANIAISLSHTHKRVALVGLDLRKPVLQKMFRGLNASKECSVVSYLIGQLDSPQQAMTPFATGENCQVDIYLPGIIPPNPSELLAMEKIGEFLQYLREHYDYVICDSAPFMPVSDSAIINKHMDYTLYIVRADFTELRMLKEINSCIEDERLKNVSIVLNGLNLEAKKYRYGYGYGYGHNSYGYGKYGHYGYGYGYGYGYPSDEEDKEKHKFNFFRKNS